MPFYFIGENMKILDVVIRTYERGKLVDSTDEFFRNKTSLRKEFVNDLNSYIHLTTEEIWSLLIDYNKPFVFYTGNIDTKSQPIFDFKNEMIIIPNSRKRGIDLVLVLENS